MAGKKKILFVLHSLIQAGGEKYAYELIRHLDASKFDVHVLTSVHPDKNDTFHNYYLKPFQDLGVTIHPFLNEREFKVHIQSVIFKRCIDSFLYRTKLLGYFQKRFYAQRKAFFDSYDAILVIDILNHSKIVHFLDGFKNYYEIHLINHLSQFDFNIYQAYLNHKAYNFVCIDQKQIDEIEGSGKLIESSFYFPLSLKISSSELLKPQVKTPYRIAVFTRINRDKPIDLVIDAFYELCQLNDEVELFVYGKVLDESYFTLLVASVAQKGLTTKIHFKGHTGSIANSIREEAIHVVWNLSIYDFVGYATLEIGGTGAAIICNNLCDDGYAPKNNPNGKLPYFYDAMDLAQYTQKVIVENGLYSLAEQQDLYFRANHDIEKNIAKFQRHLLEKL